MRSSLAVICTLAVVLSACTTIPTSEEANDAVLTLRNYGSWAWAVGIGLIWSDLLLPIPQTAVIAALGIIYGTLLGGLLGSFALITGGLLGYGLMLTSARRLAQRFVGQRSLRKMESWFDRGGAWAIILTRSLPYSIPEAMVFLAGLAGMPIRKYTVALTLGSVPTAFVFAAIGAGWSDQPVLALAMSYLLPILLLPIGLYLIRLRARQRHTVLQIAAARDTWALRGGAMLPPADATDIHADTFDLPPEAMREGFNDVTRRRHP